VFIDEFQTGRRPVSANQSKWPQRGQGASSVLGDGVIDIECPQMGQSFGQPSGVRDDITIDQIPEVDERHASAGRREMR
jgi:hypothetical protein